MDLGVSLAWIRGVKFARDLCGNHERKATIMPAGHESRPACCTAVATRWRSMRLRENICASGIWGKRFQKFQTNLTQARMFRFYFGKSNKNHQDIPSGTPGSSKKHWFRWFPGGFSTAMECMHLIFFRLPLPGRDLH